MQDSIEIIENTIVQNGDSIMVTSSVEEMAVQPYDLQTLLGAAYYPVIAIWLFLVVFNIICHWKIFVKANRPGWESIVPFYNIYVFFKIIGRSLWNLCWVFLPIVGPIIYIVKIIGSFSRSYGRGTGFALGLVFLSPIFIAILAFDKSIVYVGPNGTPAGKTDSGALDSDI